MNITSLDPDADAQKMQDRINNEGINFLVVDRGILDRIDERRELPERPESITSYARSATACYTDIVDMFCHMSASTRRRIEGIIVYTLDDPEIGSHWFVDRNEIGQRLRSIFQSARFVDIIRTRTDIYQPSGLQLFNPMSGDSSAHVATASDLKLYGAIVGEMVWSRVERMMFQRQHSERLALRAWFLRNYFVFLLVTLGLGLGASAAYDILRSTFTSIWAIMFVAGVFGIALPIALLWTEPRLLMPPDSRDRD